MCETCGNDFEVIKSVSEIDVPETCEKCGSIGERYIGSTEFYGASDWNKQDYNPALGQVVNSNAHKKRILADFRARGREMEEIGNEPVEKIHTHFEKRREEHAANRWANADRFI